MSKFTKALERIQKEKEKEKHLPEKQPSDFSVSAELEERSTSWERGVPNFRNAKPDKRIVSYHFPNSLITEQYRMLRTNLKTEMAKGQAKVILISSAIHGEGKTITAANLAHSLAEMENCKVLLVDADLRRGKVADYLGLGKDLPGLTDLLSKNLASKEIMVRNSVPNLFILPCGPVAKNPSELVGSHRFRTLIKELRNRFDYVLIDSPPIMSVADASILARETDGLLMVIQARRTPKTVVAHANQLFKQSDVRLLGYVLTNVEYQSADYHYYYHYYSLDGTAKNDFKAKSRFFFRKALIRFEKMEQSLNRWWQKKVFHE